MLHIDHFTLHTSKSCLLSWSQDLYGEMNIDLSIFFLVQYCCPGSSGSKTAKWDIKKTKIWWNINFNPPINTLVVLGVLKGAFYGCLRKFKCFITLFKIPEKCSYVATLGILSKSPSREPPANFVREI